MIVSHRHRFIFLKTRKTAGTSIEIALSKIAGRDAIVTPIKPAEAGHNPRNYDAAEEFKDRPHLPMRQLIRDRRAATEVAACIPYFNHMPAFLVRAKLGSAVWDDYFKFCFERNPWEKIASMYWWRTRELDDPPPFTEWLFDSDRVVSDWPIYSIDDECVVDVVGLYENLNVDLDEILRRVGIGFDVRNLSRAKSGFRRPGALYSPRAAEHVRRVFRHEIERFGYACPPELSITV